MSRNQQGCTICLPPAGNHASRVARSFVNISSGLLHTFLVAGFLLNSLSYIKTVTADPVRVAAEQYGIRNATTSGDAVSVETSLLQVFQVYPPVLVALSDNTLELTDGSADASVALTNDNAPTRTETLVAYSFANSYGAPFIGTYNPPDCAFNRVTWNLTVASAGRQFDRLGIIYFGDTEVFRTSTAEPTATGITWTYLKDVTNYLSLLKQPQKIIFDLGNIIDSTYTAQYNVTLIASFFSAPDSVVPADLILPISARRGSANGASVFTVPPDTASNLLTLPRNTRRAVFTVSATGQIDEEFWWSNVPQSDIDTFPQAGTLLGYSPFREVQVFIDGSLAGVAWPFDVIFTGGVVPGLWRPIVGIDAFDLKEDEIDITPWLPLLCDGNSHNFTIRVSGLSDDGTGSATLSETTGGYWLVTGKVFVWLDIANHTTTGTTPTVASPEPSLEVTSSISTTSNGTNQTLVYRVSAQRTVNISSTINTSNGTQVATWYQERAFSNLGNVTDGGNVELNVQSTTGYDLSSSGYSRRIRYPLYAVSTYSTNGENYTIEATINRGKNVQTFGQAVFPTGLESFSTAQNVESVYPSFQGALLATTQNGTATYIANSTAMTSFSFGTTEQEMTFKGLRSDEIAVPDQFSTTANTFELYHRYVQAVNSSVVQDEEQLVDTTIAHQHANAPSTHGYAVPGIKGILGHGSSTKN